MVMSTDWGTIGPIERGWYRAHNVTGRVTLPLGDDTKKIQTWQIEGYTGELRSGMQRVQRFGFSSMPLAGAKGVAHYQSGHRGFATIIADDDPRYRPTGLNGGEFQMYMVDGAKKDGTGGTTRTILQGLLGWVAKLLGATIIIGDSNNTKFTIVAPNGVDLQGDLRVTGQVVANYGAKTDTGGDASIHLTTHKHDRVQPGSGQTNVPVPGS
jgi:phage baseplate assembly protein V